MLWSLLAVAGAVAAFASKWVGQAAGTKLHYVLARNESMPGRVDAPSLRKQAALLQTLMSLAGQPHQINMAVAPAGWQPASTADQNFWAELPQAREDGQGCLQLAGGTSFLKKERFMIRDYYKELAARLETYFGGPRNSGMVLIGNPGGCHARTHGRLDEADMYAACSAVLDKPHQVSGFLCRHRKDVVAVYMLYHLALKGQRVVYHKHEKRPKLFCADGAFWPAQVPPEELDRSDTWWVLATTEKIEPARRTSV